MRVQLWGTLSDSEHKMYSICHYLAVHVEHGYVGMKQFSGSSVNGPAQLLLL